MNNLKDIDVVILCGGLGKRLRPAVGATQKTMATISGRPFLDILLQYLRQQGFRRAILCTGYQAQQVEDHYRQNALGMELEFSREKTPLGTGGAIKHAQTLIHSDPFMALNGDCFCSMDYRQLLKFYLTRKAQAVLTLSEVKDRRDYGSVAMSSSGRITGFVEKAVSFSATELPAARNFVNSGVYCFSRDILSLMPKKKFSIEEAFFPKLPNVLGEKFLGYVAQESFIDIGTPQRYREANQILPKKGRKT
jgi:D-glycero-alpha-D-manno-heptose 1-phosphate guanylyltransferase